jgi:nitrate/nitrite-specific signal transduction histidine kinase
MAEKLKRDGIEELARLRTLVARLEKELDSLEGSFGGETDYAERQPSSVKKRLESLEERLRNVEDENRDFANMCVQLREQNEALTNLYVTSYRLHATLDAAVVTQIIKEVLIELIGAEEFGILLLNEDKQRLELLDGEGVEERLPAKSFPAGEGVIGEVVTTGEPFFFEPKTDVDRDAKLPLATIPLNMNEQPVGVIVIYKLLSQKAGFSDIDHQLLDLIAAHAATALEAARLHSTRDRKLKTLENFMQLIKTQ